jgi:hypothetical protein
MHACGALPSAATTVAVLHTFRPVNRAVAIHEAKAGDMLSHHCKPHSALPQCRVSPSDARPLSSARVSTLDGSRKGWGLRESRRCYMFVSSKHAPDSEAEGLTRYFRGIVDFSFNLFFFGFHLYYCAHISGACGYWPDYQSFFFRFQSHFFAKHGLGWVLMGTGIGMGNRRFLAYMNASIRYDGQALTARTWIFLSPFPFVLSK